MKKNIFVLILLFLFISLAFSQDKELKVYYFPRPPLYINNNNNAEGFVVEIVKNILNNAKINYVFVEMPNKRIEENIKTGEYGCGIGWFKKPEREEFAIFSQPIYKDLKTVIIVNIGKSNIIGNSTTLEKLLKSNLKMGVIDGFSYGKWVDDSIVKYNPNLEKQTVEMARLVNMIAEARLDYTLMGKEEAMYYVNLSKSKEKLKIIDLVDAPEGNQRYIMFSKSVSKDLIEKVNKSITDFLKTNTYKKITSF
ncbi:MAG: hypothetical protein A2086_11245 [Spirochaetes bacterium GWD1_27_9]|nr:MAG: hypothetical protein A2Z98_02890 [Spirochaetes bacterium GWB1_27_13]OHD27065.1 MAG: hypothetical protein A2Y34_18485 [Spirochaetes bacterium GWC1_27_15]OHD38376.1 MAG: hypothetical protein A2086_11245 [Spirochaetes bacterium GWD1_27_9]